MRTDRIDIWLAPTVDPADVVPSFEMMGSFDEVVPPFLEMLENWLDAGAPATRRVAFGALLSLTVPTREDGYGKLGAYLPFAPDRNSSDLLYQINRKRSSKTVPSLQMNRLTKWSVAQIERLVVSAGSAVMLGTAAVACRLEVDFSTGVEQQDAIPKEFARAALRELRDMARETLESGDIP